MANIKMEDFSKDIDIRGDYALFIEAKHFDKYGNLNHETQKKYKGCQPTLFRVIFNGVQQSGHGWIEDGQVIQWG